MTTTRYLLAILVSAALCISGHAGDLFGKSHKPNPTERVPQLLVMVRTDADEGKREDAARELRDYDPATFPAIVPVLIDVLKSDTKPSVRAEAARSLGKIRPVSLQAGQALEAATKDGSIRVRMQARTSLVGYKIGGYHGVEAKPVEKAVPAPVVSTAQPTKLIPVPMTAPRPTAGTAKGDSIAPPLADPTGANDAPLAKVGPPILLPPPPSKPVPTQGPDLTPPD